MTLERCGGPDVMTLTAGRRAVAASRLPDHKSRAACRSGHRSRHLDSVLPRDQVCQGDVRQLLSDRMLTRSQVRSLLDALHVELGFWLDPEERGKLMRDPPKDVESFTDVVFLADGLDLPAEDVGLWRSVRKMVAAAFARSGYHGA